MQERDLVLFLPWKLEVEEILLEIFAIIWSQRFQGEIGFKTYCASLLYLSTLKH